MQSLAKLIALQIVVFLTTAWLADMSNGHIMIGLVLLCPLGALAGRWILGSWSDEKNTLESSLTHMRSNLDQQTAALAKEREEIAMIMGSVSDGILAVDPNGKPLFFNTRFAVLFTDKEFQLSRAHLGEIFRTQDVLKSFEQSLKKAVGNEVNIRLHVRGDPFPHDFALAVSPLQNNQGEVYGAVGIFHDVTELKRAEKIRIEFVANVSHELRTPLTAIKGYTDTLSEDFARGDLSEVEKFLKVITRNTQRLMQLIEDLLDLSSLEANEAVDSLEKALINTQELTEKVLLPLEGRRTDKGHSIEVTYNAPQIFADARRLEQVLVNLIENAIKYTPSNGKISVIWESRPQAIRLRIRDNGPGIPAEHHGRLFERFYRVDQARSRDLGGTGLGLAIVKHIVLLHGGTIWLESAANKGAEFICDFPTG